MEEIGTDGRSSTIANVTSADAGVSGSLVSESDQKAVVVVECTTEIGTNDAEVGFSAGSENSLSSNCDTRNETILSDQPVEPPCKGTTDEKIEKEEGGDIGSNADVQIIAHTDNGDKDFSCSEVATDSLQIDLNLNLDHRVPEQKSDAMAVDSTETPVASRDNER